MLQRSDVVRQAIIGTSNRLDRARTGDVTAFERVLLPHLGTAYRLALGIVRDPALAQDVVQDASLRAWQALPRARQQTHFRAWFLRIVANQAISRTRSPWWRRVPLTRELSVASPEDNLLTASDLRRRIAALQPPDRAALALYFYLDLPAAEVAQVLGVSTEAARSRIYRAVRHLRLSLQGEEVV